MIAPQGCNVFNPNSRQVQQHFEVLENNLRVLPDFHQSDCRNHAAVSRSARPTCTRRIDREREQSRSIDLVSFRFVRLIESNYEYQVSSLDF
jgi:hypothetical protein